jgi:hypothetical protein
VDVNVDESRGDDEAARVERFVGAPDLVGRSNFCDPPIVQQDVHPGVDACAGIDEVPPFNEQRFGRDVRHAPKVLQFAICS